MEKMEQKGNRKSTDCRGKACTKKGIESDKKQNIFILLEKPEKSCKVCRCYLDILILVISNLGMKHCIQELKWEPKSDSPPSTP